MPRRKNPRQAGLFDPESLLAGVRGLVDPERILEAEFDRSKKELLASAEKDMGLIDRVRFRVELWKLRRRFLKAKRELLG